MTLKRFETKKPTSGQIRINPKDVAETPIILHVKEIREAVVTQYAPEGKPAVYLDVASVTSGKVAKDQMWMQGAIVDALRGYVGETIGVKLTYRTGSSGRPYLGVASLSDGEQVHAEKFMDDNPLVFNPVDVPAPESGQW